MVKNSINIRTNNRFVTFFKPDTVTAVEGQGQTGTLGTQPRGRTRCLDVHGGSSGML
jgi:hypothetical protein